MDLRTTTGEKFVLDRAINRGGEAQIWTVRQEPHLVAKLYHKPTAAHQTKLTAMITAPLTRQGAHPAVAWPLHLLYRQNTFVGYLMPRAASSLPLFHYYNPIRRRRLGLPHAWPRFLHRTASNLAAAVELVHAHDHVIGDLNESNVLVTQAALVTLVDTDSFQIRQRTTPLRAISWLGTLPAQQIYRCSVGKAEYTPPELQGVDFKAIDRTPAHDNFALAVLIFYLLMDGFHPFAGVLNSGASVGRVDLHGIKHGFFPYQPPNRGTQLMVQPPPNAPAITHLHPGLQDAFCRTFVDGHRAPDRRVGAQEWKKLLQEAEDALVTCANDRSHLYTRHLRHCPACKPVAPQPPTVAPTPTANPSLPQAASIVTAAMQRLPATWATVIGPLAAHSFTTITQFKPALTQLKPTLQQLQPKLHRLQTEWRSHVTQAQRAIATMPDRLVAAQRRVVTQADLVGGWLLGTLTGTPLATLAVMGGYALLPRIAELTPLAIRQQVMLLTIIFATVMGACQAYALRHTLLPWSYLRYAWVGGAAMSGAALGAAGFRLLGADWDQVQAWSTQATLITLLAALFGISTAFLQSLLLRQHLRLRDDGRIWTLVNGLSGLLTAQGWLWGQSLPYGWQLAHLPDWQLNAGLGALVGLGIGSLLSGGVLLWMVQGPVQRFHLRHFALRLLHRSRTPPHFRQGAVRWVRALLLLILLWLLLQIMPQFTGAAPLIPPLPAPVVPHLAPP